MLCARECPDWCIYIDSHKETLPAVEGGRERQRNVLDRFAIDWSLCMYCGICVEVCPFDALFWAPSSSTPSSTSATCCTRRSGWPMVATGRPRPRRPTLRRPSRKRSPRPASRRGGGRRERRRGRVRRVRPAVGHLGGARGDQPARRARRAVARGGARLARRRVPGPRCRGRRAGPAARVRRRCRRPRAVRPDAHAGADRRAQRPRRGRGPPARRGGRRHRARRAARGHARAGGGRLADHARPGPGACPSARRGDLRGLAAAVRAALGPAARRARRRLAVSRASDSP